jgi:glutathione S-transferase
MRLVIGSKNLSSWSLRAWLALRVAGLPFEEVVVPLARADTRARLDAISPSGKVPVLQDGPVTIWDSLAIAEYAAELVPSLWPEDRTSRALARAYAAEMHAGFADLRTFLPFDATARFEPPGRLLRGVARDLARIQALWQGALERQPPGSFLFGRFSIADAMFAPVACRFVTYAVPLDPVCARYVTTVVEHPAMRQWLAEARAEVESAHAETPALREPAPAPQPAGATVPSRPARPALPPRAAPFDARQVTRPAPGAPAAPGTTSAAAPPRAPAPAAGPAALPPEVTYLDPTPPEPAPPAQRPSAQRVPMRPADAGFSRRELPPAAPAPRRAAGLAAPESAAETDVPVRPTAVVGEAPGAPDQPVPGAATAPTAPPGGAAEAPERPVNRFAAALSAGRLAWQRRQEELGGGSGSAPPPRPAPRSGGIKPIGSGIHRRR